VDFLKQVCGQVEPGKSVYPFVFPLHKAPRHSVDLVVRAGCYCVDAFTPLNPDACLSARRAVNCALTAAETLLQGYRFAYALARPPGHHAERRVFGGFCYFNSAAIAAQFLSAQGGWRCWTWTTIMQRHSRHFLQARRCADRVDPWPSQLRVSVLQWILG